jgi:tape measure domain-containing protein
MPEPKASILITLKNQVSSKLTGIKASLKSFENGLNTAAGKVKGWTVKAVAMGAAVTGLGTVFLTAAGKVEQWKVRFETMAGSAEKGQEVLADLTKLASESPFDMPQVVEGAARLNAMGFEADELTDRMRMLGDITAGVGKEKMPQLVLAFGQVRTAGKLTGQELRQFNEAGVDLLGGLAENLGKTKAEIKDMVSEGKIGFKDVDDVLKAMTSSGGRFFGLMDKLSDTFLGKVSNIKDNLFQWAVAIGENLMPEMTGLTDKVQEFTENESNIQKIVLAFKALFLSVKAVGIAMTDFTGKSVLSFLKLELQVAKATKATVSAWGTVKSWFGVVDESNKRLVAEIENDIDEMQRNILEKDADLKSRLASSEQEWTDAFIGYLSDQEEVYGDFAGTVFDLNQDIFDNSESTAEQTASNWKEAFSSAMVDAAQRSQARALRDINRDFERGEIDKQAQIKRTRDVMENFEDKMADIRDEALDLSKIRLTDLLDPIAAGLRIDDANKSLSESRDLLKETEEAAKKLNIEYQRIRDNTQETRNTEQSGLERVSTLSSQSFAPLTTNQDNNIISALNMINSKISNINVTIDVDKLADKLSKSITQSQNLNDKGRI